MGSRFRSIRRPAKVFNEGHGFEVVWVHTVANSAEMVDGQPFSDRPVSPLVSKLMGGDGPVEIPKLAIAAVVERSLE